MFAVDSAVEAGQPLIVANITVLEPLAMSMILGYDALEEFTPEVSASVRRPVELADSLGVSVERLRIRSPRPIQALLELARERRPGSAGVRGRPARIGAPDLSTRGPSHP